MNSDISFNNKFINTNSDYVYIESLKDLLHQFHDFENAYVKLVNRYKEEVCFLDTLDFVNPDFFYFIETIMTEKIEDSNLLLCANDDAQFSIIDQNEFEI